MRMHGLQQMGITSEEYRVTKSGQASAMTKHQSDISCGSAHLS